MKRLTCVTFAIVIILLLFADRYGVESTHAQESSSDWRSQWLVEEGFNLEKDVEGLSYPSAIAFVPNPGPEPNDPLYFVTELYGTVKVVTNDRTVHTFAESFFELSGVPRAPEGRRGQSGLAGICLDPEHGYVFVTFAYQNASGDGLRNNIVRFQSTPGQFSLKPIGRTEFPEIFADHLAGPSHQIGSCQVNGDNLYVSVGDGYFVPDMGQDRTSILGKILRLSLDGKPVPQNPFYENNDPTIPDNFILSYGHRNPFSLKLIGDQLYVFENGPGIDRFFRQEIGANYLWDGTDESMSLNADAIFAPSVGPVQMDYLPPDSSIFPAPYTERFYVALSGEIPGLLTIPYDLDEHRVSDKPVYVVRYEGEPYSQAVAGLAFGPDGLYFSAILPESESTSSIYRLTYSPGSDYPYSIAENLTALDLIYQNGCLGCHRLGEVGSSFAPSLTPAELMPRLQERLNSPQYREQIEEVNQINSEPQISFGDARDAVLTSDGNERVQTWIKYRLLEPRFDNTYATMPNLNLTEEEAASIAAFLTEEGGDDLAVMEYVRRYVTLRNIGLAGIGYVGGLTSAFLLFSFWRRYRKRNRTTTAQLPN